MTDKNSNDHGLTLEADNNSDKEDKENENEKNENENKKVSNNERQPIITPITMEQLFNNYFKPEYYEESAHDKIHLEEFVEGKKHAVAVVQNATYGLVEERSEHAELFVMCECILVLALEEAYKNYMTLYSSLSKDDPIHAILFKNITDIHNIYEVFYNNYFVEEIYLGYVPSIVNYYWTEYCNHTNSLIDGEKLKKILNVKYASCGYQWLAQKCKEIFLAITSMIRDHNIYAYNNSHLTLQIKYFPNVLVTSNSEWLLYRAYVVNQAMRLWQYDIINDIENASQNHSECAEIKSNDKNSYLFSNNAVKIRFVPIMEKYNLQ